MTNVREEETPEQTAQRKQSDRLQKARLREEETPEQSSTEEAVR